MLPESFAISGGWTLPQFLPSRLDGPSELQIPLTGRGDVVQRRWVVDVFARRSRRNVWYVCFGEWLDGWNSRSHLLPHFNLRY